MPERHVALTCASTFPAAHTECRKGIMLTIDTIARHADALAVGGGRC